MTHQHPCQFLTYLATEQDSFGVFHITVLLRGKEYTYAINSEYAYRLFLKKLRNGQQKRALNILNKFKIEAFHGKEKEDIDLD